LAASTVPPLSVRPCGTRSATDPPLVQPQRAGRDHPFPIFAGSESPGRERDLEIEEGEKGRERRRGRREREEGREREVVGDREMGKEGIWVTEDKANRKPHTHQ
jgi:hypothetical protein